MEGLRTRTARGTVINAAFLVALSGLSMAKGFVAAAFLTQSEYGLWGIAIVSFATLVWLKQVGIGDKFVQQDEPDQELAFQRAFTLELGSSLAFWPIAVAATPLFALLYDRPEMVAPGLVLTLIVPGMALQSPIWIHYRRMAFVRQRVLQSIDPVVGFVLTVALAVAGAGEWALVIGAVTGTWASALAAVATTPTRLAWRFDRAVLRQYFEFSWPTAVASASGLIIAQLSLLVGTWELGLAGVGAITLAATISAYTDRVDQIVTQTLYPAIARVQERTDLLFEAFVKSNRLTLMWGAPFGIGLALFAADLIDFGIGSRWEPALLLLQVFGVLAALNHVGFNWDAFYRARGQTRPQAAVGMIGLAAFVASAIPLLVLEGLDGFAVGMAVTSITGLLARIWFIRRLFPAFQFLWQAARAFAPTAPAVAVVLAARAAESGPRTGTAALAELVGYLAVTVAATVVLERALLREVVGYLRRASLTGAR